MVGGNAEKIALDYAYASKLRFADVGDFFSQTLPQQGWQLRELSDEAKSAHFVNGNYEWSIELSNAGGIGLSEYSVYCSRRVR